MTFTGIEGYGTTVAEVRDVQAHPDFQRRGIGSRILEYAERAAKERGADLLRSEAGTGNIPSHLDSVREGPGRRPGA